MASAIIGNISMFLGEDLPLVDEVFQADGITPQNVSAWTATFIIHPPGDPGTPLITKTTGAGTITFSNPAITPPVAYNWALNLTVLNADTVSATGAPIILPKQTYGYRYTRTDAGNNTVITTGLFTII